MSDYLWDKAGEKDAEVERLETLLAAFAHRARPLELPAEESFVAPRPTRPHGFAERFGFVGRLRASRVFAPAGLAAAAALLLVFFGAAALLMRARSEDNDGRKGVASTAAGPKVEKAKDEKAGVEKAGVEKAAGESLARASFESLSRAPVEGLARASGGRKGLRVASAREKPAALGRGKPGVGVARDRELTDEGFTFEAMRAGGGASALVENARVLTKEQLVYALRLTGEKLRGVRQKAQGFDGPESPPR